MAKYEHLLKTAYKNQYIFEKIFWTSAHGSLFGKFLELFKKYAPGKSAIVELPLHNKSPKVQLDGIEGHRKIFAASLMEVKGWSKAKIAEFNADIEKLRLDLNLGAEWRTPIIAVIVSRYFFPPLYNLNITSDKNADGKRRVVLELNPDTSLDDLKSAWPKIRAAQKRGWPSFPKVNYTGKLFENLKLFKKGLAKGHERFETLNDAKRKGGRKTDREIVTEIWEDEEDISRGADLKRMARLRQNRHRMVGKR
jgi:hypothetical protein